MSEKKAQKRKSLTSFKPNPAGSEDEELTPQISNGKSKKKRQSLVALRPIPQSSDEEEAEEPENEESEDEAQENEEKSESDSEAQEGEKMEVDKEKKTKDLKKMKKPGLIYISNIPKHMNVAILKEFLEEYGEVGRIYLVPEKKFKHKKVNAKNKKPLAIHFTEGWVEFESKKVAKFVAENLNAKPITRKKNSRFCDVLWNIKYLSGFKWAHLSMRLTYEQQIYKQKRLNEISQAKKEASFFQENLDKSKRFEKMRKKLLKTQEKD